MLQKIDPLVITTADPSKCLSFYNARGFKTREDGRAARYAPSSCAIPTAT